MQLAVYRTYMRAYGTHEDASGLTPYYFIAPSGLEERDALVQRVSPWYIDQTRAIVEMIDKQHEYNRA